MQALHSYPVEGGVVQDHDSIRVQCQPLQREHGVVGLHHDVAGRRLILVGKHAAATSHELSGTSVHHALLLHDCCLDGLLQQPHMQSREGKAQAVQDFIDPTGGVPLIASMTWGRFTRVL